MCSVLQEYTIKTGKTVPIAFWYMPKNSSELLKRKDNVYFLGTSRDKNMNRFVFVFKTDANIVNIVNDSIELFQILAVDIPLSFLESTNSRPNWQVVIDEEEIEMVEPEIAEAQVVEPLEEELELANTNTNNPSWHFDINEEDLESSEEESESKIKNRPVPFSKRYRRRRRSLPTPEPEPAKDKKSLYKQFQDLDVEEFGRGQRRRKKF